MIKIPLYDYFQELVKSNFATINRAKPATLNGLVLYFHYHRTIITEAQYFYVQRILITVPKLISPTLSSHRYSNHPFTTVIIHPPILSAAKRESTVSRKAVRHPYQDEPHP